MRSEEEDKPHSIRLRGRWEFIVGADGPRGKQRLPGPLKEALGDAFRGAVTYRRRFNRVPLGDGESLWIVFAGLEQSATAALNGVELGAVGPLDRAEFEVTSLQRPHNELLIQYDMGDGPSGSGDMRLEIRGSR